MLLAIPCAARAEDAQLKSAIEGILADQQGIYSVAILDLWTGDRTIINGDQAFRWASTVKLPLVLYTYVQVGNGNAQLTDQIAYTENEYESGSGHLQGHIRVGDRYAIDYLTRIAILNSDNIAKLMLLHHFGRPNIEAWAETLGGHFSADGLQAEEMLAYLSYIYDHRDEPMIKRYISLLNRTPRKRIGRFLPADLVLAAKGGALPGEFHNAGVIFTEHPVALAIYSKNTNEFTSAYVEGLVGKAVYEAYREQTPVRVVFAGNEVAFDQDGAPFVTRGITVVPLRKFAESAGFTVTWDQPTKSVTLSSAQGRTIVFSIDSNLVRLSGAEQPITLSQRVVIVRGRTYIPLRGISEAMGLNVTWDQETKSVIVAPLS